MSNKAEIQANNVDIQALINKANALPNYINTSDATATANDIVDGKTAYINSNKVTGSMTNNGAVSKSLTTPSEFYTIPAGYHNGSGKVNVNMTNNGAVNQTLNAGDSYTIPAGYHNGSGKVTANNLASQTDGTAVAGDILSGKTAYVDGAKITGTMADLQANSNITLTSTNSTKVVLGDNVFTGTSSDGVNRLSIRYAGGSGYLKNNTLVGIPYDTLNNKISLTANKLAKGQKVLGITGTYTSDATAVAADIANGKTAYVNGSKITGTYEKPLTGLKLVKVGEGTANWQYSASYPSGSGGSNYNGKPVGVIRIIIGSDSNYSRIDYVDHNLTGASTDIFRFFRTVTVTTGYCNINGTKVTASTSNPYTWNFEYTTTPSNDNCLAIVASSANDSSQTGQNEYVSFVSPDNRYIYYYSTAATGGAAGTITYEDYRIVYDG